jgi:hypothetical protein
MARPIEATPVLRGEDAVAFLKAVQNPKPYTPPTFDFERMGTEIKRITQALKAEGNVSPNGKK